MCIGKTLCAQVMAFSCHGPASLASCNARWQLKHFMGNSENAVKPQVWCAVATYILIAIVKKELQRDASPYTCLQISSVSVFEKTELSCALQADLSRSDPPDAAKQLNFFNL